MGDWYTIGVAVGVGVALGVLAAGLLAWWRFGAPVSALLAGAAGVVAGLVTNRWIGADWIGPLAGIAGGLVGAFSATAIAQGALRRGGTPGGTAFLLGSAALALFLLALIPVIGFVQAAAAPVVAARARRRKPDRHAGLRTLAK
jgi:hypothetical protein